MRRWKKSRQHTFSANEKAQQSAASDKEIPKSLAKNHQISERFTKSKKDLNDRPLDHFTYY
jgi:hypothetical protein